MWNILTRKKSNKIIYIFVSFLCKPLHVYVISQSSFIFMIKICPLSVVLVTFHIFIFLSRTTGPISNKLGTVHPWVKEIQVSSNEGPCPFLRGGNNEIVKIHWWNFFKNIPPYNHWANFSQTWHKASLGEGNSSLFKWRTRTK